eukprot:TRINITY_DN57068_c0_g1_i1.p1 TRINITY_DN57068_c0_g1~~TRINITY_DN57068_c0_g1_i1.p1  ORF type:complete len:484 (-),score=65.76 TRINITY_DN57068_c0_g1_i1:4-1455(-)
MYSTDVFKFPFIALSNFVVLAILVLPFDVFCGRASPSANFPGYSASSELAVGLSFNSARASQAMLHVMQYSHSKPVHAESVIASCAPPFGAVDGPDAARLPAAEIVMDPSVGPFLFFSPPSTPHHLFVAPPTAPSAYSLSSVGTPNGGKGTLPRRPAPHCLIGFPSGSRIVAVEATGSSTRPAHEAFTPSTSVPATGGGSVAVEDAPVLLVVVVGPVADTYVVTVALPTPLANLSSDTAPAGCRVSHALPTTPSVAQPPTAVMSSTAPGPVAVAAAAVGWEPIPEDPLAAAADGRSAAVLLRRTARGPAAALSTTAGPSLTGTEAAFEYAVVPLGIEMMVTGSSGSMTVQNPGHPDFRVAVGALATVALPPSAGGRVTSAARVVTADGTGFESMWILSAEHASLRQATAHVGIPGANSSASGAVPASLGGAAPEDVASAPAVVLWAVRVDANGTAAEVPAHVAAVLPLAHQSGALAGVLGVAS